MKLGGEETKETVTTWVPMVKYKRS